MPAFQTTVYRQASKVRPDGTVVYKGEDALPYARHGILLVADGLGGAGAIRHQNFDKDLFEEDKLLDALFKDVYDDYGDNEEFKKYVKDSFAELRAVKHCYLDNVYNIKKSGYFGSRILSASFLHQLLCEKELMLACALFFVEIYNRRQSAHFSRKKALEDISRRATKIIKDDITKIAEKVGLVYESAYSGLALLGTTICASLMCDRGKFIDVLYFMAGDSRPYMLNENGLFQVIKDEEGEDGGMTNYVRANGDFTIQCVHKRFTKPCILFNATDGVFDSRAFISPLAMEKLLLEMVIQSQDMDEVGGKLTETFVGFGTHDDSSSMAIRAYGFKSFADIIKCAQRRLDNINKLYLKDFPTLLDKDYSAEVEEFYFEREANFKATVQELWGVSSIAEYYKNRVAEDGAYTAEIDGEITSCRLDIKAQRESIKKILVKGLTATHSKGEVAISSAMSLKEEVEADADNVLALIDGGGMDVETLNLSEQATLELEHALEQYNNGKKQHEALKNKRNGVIEEGAKKLLGIEWKERGDDLLADFVIKNLITEKQVNAIKEAHPIKNDEDYAKVKESARKQRRILEIYENNYNRIMREDK